MDFSKPQPLADSIDAFIYVIDYHTKHILYLNGLAKELYPHLTPESTCYQSFLGLETPCPECPLANLYKSHKPHTITKWVETAKRFMQVKYSDFELEDGSHVCVATGVDITPIQNSLTNIERILDSIQAAAYTVNPTTHQITSINSELRKMLPSIEPFAPCYTTLWGESSPCSFCPLKNHEENNTSNHFDKFNCKLNRYLSIDFARVDAIDGSKQAVFTAYDVTKLVESQQKLREMVSRDVLTGIKNRISFLDDMSEMFQRQNHCCLCSLNIKFMRRYNVLYGKKEGDQLLIKVASLFSEKYVKDKVYRIDGAKLGFLAEGEEEIKQLRERIEEAEALFHSQWKNQNYGIFFDKAFVCFPDFANSPEQCIYNAEYLLKKNGKKNQSLTLEFDKTEEALLHRQNYIEAIVQEGPSSGRFEVYYQPIYDIQMKAYTKCEALLRLYDSATGWISPVEFIPIAEETGTIVELGQFVLKEACRLLSDRRNANLPPLYVNVNVSPVEFTRKNFYKNVVETVKEWDVPPEFIQLEVTESSFIDSIDSTMEVMKSLIAEGFTFAVDDFGTGYSNLGNIGTMPLECLKLDKSFMDRLLQSESHKMIVTTVIELAKGLNLSIVAEGIENEQQYEMIKNLGSNYIQGFLFSKPLPRDKFENFLAAQVINNGESPSF